jgi:predicted DNA-binding antitoxin AbrB/MazE fold protein
MPNTVTAVFRDGVLKPTRKLKLRPNEKVKLHIVRQKDRGPAASMGPLAGAFPALASVSAEQLSAAKRSWRQGVSSQLRRLGRKGAPR